jgi:hypothetical protein
MKTIEIKQSLFESYGLKDSYFKTWEKEIHPIICEVALNPAQIQQLFQQIEQGATAAGGNRTGLGKGIDTVSAAKDKISDIWYNKFGAMLQNSAPVQAFDKSYDDMKAKIRAANPDSKIIAAIDKYGEYAKNHPNMQKFILGIVGSLAAALGIAAAGGVAAGALAVGTGTGVAVGIVNIADRLLKGGEKLSTSLGRGATAGITAGLTAAAVTKVAGILKDTLASIQQGREVHVITINPGTPMEQKFNLLPADGRAYDKFGQKWLDALKDTSGGMDGFFDPDSASNSAMTAATKAMDAILDKAMNSEYQQACIAAAQKAGESAVPIANAIKGVTALQQAITPVASAIAGQAGGNAQPAQAESRTYTTEQVTALFEHVVIAQNLTVKLQEGIWDDIKSGAGKTLSQVAGVAGKAAGATTQQVSKGIKAGAQAVAQKAQTIGHNITTKTTADKLQSAWKAAGSPTDSEAIVDLLTAQGIDKSVITGAMKAVAPFASVDRSRLPDVSKLNLQQKQQLLKQLDAVEQGQQPTSAPALTVPGTSAKSAPGAPVTQPTSAPKVVGVPTDASPIAVPGGGATGLTVPGVSNTTATPAAPTTTGGGSPAKIPKPKVPYSAIQPKVTGTSAPAVGKVSPARNPGAPTADEYDKFQQKVQAAMKK